MMNKFLKKYTTIPPELYVTRSADHQLKRIVEEMQRPGYVLVARQMGKTNLLFNAKRTLENESRLFIYIDVSNLFTYERDCYRNIIDNVIEPNDKLFESLVPKLISIRNEELPPHKEYQKSLRIILKHFKADIVIILDEIDALKNVDYSDNIFSQIRSNYFARTNYPEFEKLTYLLSGVIDPTELIKDRNKSPFNIGEKIYLDDFNKEEYNDFIYKSGLKLKPEIKDEIFSWSNGNPRLTFDICSEVESFLLDKEDISIEQLKYLIQNKYLTTFDIPPVDHIRELVKSDKKVRNAVLDIQLGKNNISDEMKKKLYLFGIINSRFDEATVIKNRILKLSLSIDWIKSIDKQAQDNYTYGIAKWDEREFEEAIHALTEYINNSHATKAKIEVCNYHIAYAYYQLREYGKAIEYFSKEYSTQLFKRNALSLIGCCKIGVGEQEEGYRIFEEIIKTKTYNFAYRNAIMNLAPKIILENKSRAIELYEELYNSTYVEGADIETSEDELNTIRTLAQYYLADIYYVSEDIETSVKHISLALNYASPSDSLYLKFFKYSITGMEDESVKSEIVELIINNKLKFDTIKGYPISFCEKHLFDYLRLIFNEENIDLFEKLLCYASTELYQNRFDNFHLVYILSQGSNRKGEMLNYILKFSEGVNDNLLFNVYRDLSFLNSINKSIFFEYFNKYKILFEQLDIVEKIDIHLFAIGIKHYSDINKINDGLMLCNIIHNRIQSVNFKDLEFESVIIYYWFALLNFSIDNKESTITYANKTIQLIKEFENKSNSMIDEKGLKLISEQMESIIKSFSKNATVVKVLKYGRNEIIKVKYLDGKIVENKYKRLEADILAERCKIMPST